MLDLSIIQDICIWLLPVLFAITLHEAAHGYVAYRLGDPTAKLLGRVTANPIKHIDPIGTVLVPLALGFMTQFKWLFGWAKPVPISSRNFKSPKRDMALVAIAGPLANLLMAFFWAVIIKISLFIDANITNALADNNNIVAQFMFLSGRAGVFINLILCVLNLLPIPPLDGSRVVSSLLPGKYDYYYAQLEPYGFFILVLLLATGMLQIVLAPLFNILLNIIALIFHF